MRTKVLATILMACGITIPFGLRASAQETQTVNASVSALAVSLTVSPGTVNYGTMAFDTSRKSTDAAAGNVTFTATNTGNVLESFLVHGNSATGDGFSWALSDSLACEFPSARNKFRHAVQVVDGPPAFFLALTEDTLASDVAATTGEVKFTSEFYMPCPGSDGAGKVASTSITVVAIGP